MNVLGALLLLVAALVATVTLLPDSAEGRFSLPDENTVEVPLNADKMAYFREDLGLSLHHMHWHAYHPYAGERKSVDKDRRGELLLYMHGQLLARYSAESMSNGLPPVQRLGLRKPIEVGYDPRLNDKIASQVYAARANNTLLKDINRDSIKIKLEDVERSIREVMKAIENGAIVDAKGKRIALTAQDGANILGNILESNSLSLNEKLYGNVMNQGHFLIAWSHDPEMKGAGTAGAMSDTTTALRDPAFYQWHAVVQEVLRYHNRRLPTYKPEELAFPDVSVRGVDVQTEGGGAANELLTHLQATNVLLTKGLDLRAATPVDAHLTHLQHEAFTYSIQVENKASTPKEGYVRIFTAPVNDENGKPLDFARQRLLMIELDKFVTVLQPGMNVVKRRSSESSVTISMERTFRSLESGPAAGRALEEFNFCGCGLPQHLLIPKGSTMGSPFTLVVTVTDYKQDKVEQVLESSCNSAPSLCGVFGGKYPDRRPMGFPFERTPRVDSLPAFLTPNMFAKNIVIRFRDTIKPKDAILFSSYNKTPAISTS